MSGHSAHSKKALLHPWPGNVRELRNALERAAILARGETITVEDLELDATPRSAPRRVDDPIVPWEEAGRRCIAAALRATGGRIYGADGAAAALGLKPTTLQTKMRRLGLRRADFVAS